MLYVTSSKSTLPKKGVLFQFPRHAFKKNMGKLKKEAAYKANVELSCVFFSRLFISPRRVKATACLHPKYGGGWKMIFLFKWVILMFHVNFRGVFFLVFLSSRT